MARESLLHVYIMRTGSSMSQEEYSLARERWLSWNKSVRRKPSQSASFPNLKSISEFSVSFSAENALSYYFSHFLLAKERETGLMLISTMQINSNLGF